MFNAISWRRALRAACIATLPLAGWLSPAHAVTNTLPAGTCQPIWNSSGKYRVHLTQYGIVNPSDENFSVLCPVVRHHTGGSIALAVMGSVDAGASMGCALYSNIAEGSLLYVKSFNVTGPAVGSTPFTRTLYIGSDDAPLGALLTAACTLPANYKGRPRGLLVTG